MTHTTRFFVSTLCLLPGAVIAALAQQTRDLAPTTAPRTGTAVIAGVIISDDQTPAPLRRAIVKLSGDELSISRAAISDDDGRFTFASLPAGRYAMTASKPAFITTAYGAKRPGRPGITFAVTEGQHVTDIAVHMPRGAVIAGTITTATGQGAVGASVVVALVPSAGSGSTQAATVATATTDDRGVYRVFGLLPGDYLVAAIPARPGLGDVTVMGSAELDAAFQELERGVRGTAPGRVATPSGASNAPPAKGSTVGAAPVFFPGTSVGADATVVALSTGEERDGVDFGLNLVSVIAIDGVITSPLGPLTNAELRITPAALTLKLPVGASSPSLLGVGAPVLSLPPTPEGRFKYTGLTPGRYTIQARSVATAGNTGRAGNGGDGGGASVWFASVDVTATGEDIAGLTLSLQPAMRVSGRVVFDGAVQASPTSQSGLTDIRVNLIDLKSTGSSAVNSTMMGLIGVPPAQVHEDGTFEFMGVMPATYRVAVTLPAKVSGWELRSMMVGGRDALDAFLEVTPSRNVSDAVLALTDRHSDISGALQDAAGQPAPGYSIVVIPADRSLWLAGSRRMKVMRPASDGEFLFKGLPAGAYLLAAVTDADSSDLNDPKFLEQVAAASVKITLAEGDHKRQDLRLAGG
jgi:hypothetical protein